MTEPNTGEWGPEQPADPEVQALADEVKPQFLEQSGVDAVKFQASVYLTLGGETLITKVNLGEDQYSHLKIQKPLSLEEKLSLIGYQLGKTKGEPITYF